MKFSKIILSAFASLLFIGTANANLSISPLKHELTIESGKQKSETIKVTNNEKTAITLYTSKEDFIAGDDTGTPTFIKPQDQKTDLYSLSNWITIDNNNITLAPGETREIKFSVKVPVNGEPGGHYGAIFFSPGAPSGAQVAVVQRLGVLILINVPGDIKISGDLTGFDVGNKIENKFEVLNSFNTFPVYFDVKFKNDGNTHLKPTGKIELIDENGEILKNIGKESITSPQGAYIGEKMVDYIPVNDGAGNVLPKSERKFEGVWSGFGYTELNADGTKSVKFKNLTEYYASKAAEKRAYLQFYEQIHTRKVNKKITANLSLSYEGKDKEKKDFKQTKTFTVTYDEQYVGVNYFMVGFILLIIGGFIYYIRVVAPKSKEKLKKQLLEEMRNK
ncbi:DUF916 domain-containing protein [Candidatus Gracilibacteria bacterium]|nr:DUF916 domain-containing protein [Candidatus Gracilibacteria bacterium]